MFVNNPSLGNVYAWEGDFLNGGELTGRFVPGATPIDDGYPLVNYVSVPNPIYGSVPSPGGYLVVDPYNPDGWAGATMAPPHSWSIVSNLTSLTRIWTGSPG